MHIRAWVVSLLDAGQSPRSANRRLSCLKTYFKYLRKRGVLAKDPLQKVVAPKTNKRLPVFVPERDLNALFTKIAFPAGFEGALHRLVLETLYGTGLRRSELTALQCGDLDFSRMVLRVQGKGAKQRFVPVAPYLGQLLQEFLQLRNETFPDTSESALFLSKKGVPLQPGSVYLVVKRYLSAVTSVEQRSPHVLRHSFATHLSDQGADLNAIKELLGHSNLAATQVYMHNSIQKLKNVYEQAHPNAELPDGTDTTVDPQT